jgi:hypothetical protein
VLRVQNSLYPGLKQPQAGISERLRRIGTLTSKRGFNKLSLFQIFGKFPKHQ